MSGTYEKHDAVTEDGYSEWVQPVTRGYRMQCCDCGLVHTLDFRIDDGNVQFRVKRNNRATSAIRAWRKKKGESIAKIVEPTKKRKPKS